MKILILGGSGFIGSHVADEFSNLSHDVTIFDEKKSPYIKKNQKFIKGNICNKSSLKKIKKFSNRDQLCRTVDLDEAYSNPLKTAENNIIGLINILNACMKHKIKKFIHASSIC